MKAQWNTETLVVSLSYDYPIYLPAKKYRDYILSPLLLLKWNTPFTYTPLLLAENMATYSLKHGVGMSLGSG